MWTLLVLIVVLWVLYRWQNRRLIALSKQIKCNIRAYPFIGHALMLIKGDGVSRMKLIQSFGREAIKQGGITHIWTAALHYTVLVDPNDIEVVMKTSLEKDDVMRFARKLIGNGTIFAPVSIWRPRRKILVPTFAPKYLYHFGHIFSRQSQMLVEKLQDLAGKGPVSLSKHIAAYAMDSVCETALGVAAHNQKKAKVPFLVAFETCSRLVAKRMFQPWLYHEAIYKLLSDEKHFQEHKAVMCDTIDELIDLKRAEMRNARDEPKIPETKMKTFLELMIEASGGENGYSNQELQEEILMLVLGGTDTSGLAIAFATTLLSRHPDVQEKVYQEILSVIGDTKRPIVPEDLPHLKYLEAVVRETVRLYPSAPLVVRKIEKDVELPSGITLVDGCRVIINIWGTHRNPRYWGDDAELFRPERFIDAPLKHPAAFLAFSCGPRVCIGYQYAIMSVKTAISTLVSRFKILPADGSNVKNDTPLDVSFDVMMKDVSQCTVRLETRL